MKRKEIVDNISRGTGIRRKVCNEVIDALALEITNALMRGENVYIQNFMKLSLGERAERMARNPSTGEIELFPAVKTIKVKMCDIMRNAINDKPIGED